MHFAFSSNAFTNYSLYDSISEIAKIGYKGIEIMCDIPHAYPPNFGKDEMSKIINNLNVNNLQVSNLNAFTLFALGDTYHPSWIEHDPKSREKRIQHTIDCVEIASKIGAKSISIEPGGPIGSHFEERSRSDMYDLFREGINKVTATR